MKISLKDFLLTGHFGRIQLGMTDEEISKELGAPKDRGDYDDDSFSFFYGEYELFFDRESRKLLGLQNDHLATRDQDDRESIVTFKNNQFEIDAWIIDLKKNSEYSEIISHLDSEGINYRTEQRPFENVIHFNSGVHLDFTDQDSWIEAETQGREVIEGTIQNRDQYILNGIRLYV
jgi:hypothetical protein